MDDEFHIPSYMSTYVVIKLILNICADFLIY